MYYRSTAGAGLLKMRITVFHFFGLGAMPIRRCREITLLSCLVGLLFNACAGGGVDGSPPSINSGPGTTGNSIPAVPSGFSINPGTSFLFTWNPAPGATFYRLFEDATGGGAVSQIGSDTADTSLFHSVGLWERMNASYFLQACNQTGCSASTQLNVAGLITSSIAYAKPSNTGSSWEFGVAIALSNDGHTLVVGANGEDSVATDSGSAYIFTRNNGLWSQSAYLKASNPGDEDLFGVSIAISGDGSTVAVGAYHEDSGADGVDGNQLDDSAPDAGAVYIYTRSGASWTQQAYVKAFNSDAGDVFGVSVALSNDGNTLAVGGYREDSGSNGVDGDQTDNSAPDAGAVYVFTRTGGVWSQQAYVKASNSESGDHFGSYIGLSGDGNTLCVGARFEDGAGIGVGGNQADNSATDAGAVYIFAHNGGAWSQQAYIKASNTGSGDLFGAMVSLSNDGNTLAVGARHEDSAAVGVGGNQADDSATDSGAVYIYTRNTGTWTQQAYLKPTNTDAGDWFGVRVALSSDGNILAVGSQYESSQATGIDGNQADNNAPESGAAYIFKRSGSVWTQERYIKASNTGAGDLFGGWIALSADGKTLAIGAQEEDSDALGIGGDQFSNNAPDAGAVYIY